MPLLIVDDLGMRKLPITAAEDLLEIIMLRNERASRRFSVPSWRLPPVRAIAVGFGDRSARYPRLKRRETSPREPSSVASSVHLCVPPGVLYR